MTLRSRHYVIAVWRNESKRLVKVFQEKCTRSSRSLSSKGEDPAHDPAHDPSNLRACSHAGKASVMGRANTLKRAAELMESATLVHRRCTSAPHRCFVVLVRTHFVRYYFDIP